MSPTAGTELPSASRPTRYGPAVGAREPPRSRSSGKAAGEASEALLGAPLPETRSAAAGGPGHCFPVPHAAPGRSRRPRSPQRVLPPPPPPRSCSGGRVGWPLLASSGEESQAEFLGQALSKCSGTTAGAAGSTGLDPVSLGHEPVPDFTVQSPPEILGSNRWLVTGCGPLQLSS